MRVEVTSGKNRGWSRAAAVLILYTRLLYTGFLHLSAAAPEAKPDICSSCHANASCTIKDGSQTCTCNYGFIGNGISLCTDKNECQIGAEKICGDYTTCYNTHGSYYCTCNEGYRPSNNMELFTPNDGTHCTTVDCGLAPVLLNTVRYPSVNTTYGSIVVYQCLVGYVRVRGNTTSVCSAQGRWQGANLECEAVDCGLPPVLLNTVRYPSANTTYGSIVVYQCLVGYVRVRGNTTLVCSAQGLWEGAYLECEAVDCGSPPVLLNTVRYPPANTTYGSTVVHQCLVGYVGVRGNGTSVCSAQGLWEGVNLECEAVDCGSPPVLMNTVRYPPANTTYGSIVVYQCLVGYVRVRGNTTSVCSAQGRWQGANLECEAVNCGLPPVLLNTVRYPPANTTYGSTGVYQCLVGYMRVRGNGTLVCSAQGRWQGPNLECEAVDCGSPPVLLNTVRYPPANTTYGSTVLYQCLVGYVRVRGNGTLVCSAQGRWEGVNLKCEEVDCGQPLIVPNTHVTWNQSTKIWSRIYYQCLEGFYSMEGRNMSMCTEKGHWQEDTLTCKAVDCGIPAHVPNVCPPSIRRTTYGSEIQYRCKTGYVSEGGSGTLVCSARGHWEGANFTCTAVDCGTPAHVPNVCPPSVIQTTYGSEIQYRCKTGYVSEGGSGTLVCSARGQWEGANFTCTAVDCGTPAHVPNVCPPSIIQTTYGSEIQYRCKTGYVSEGGNGTLVCSARGQWEGANFTCTAVDCGTPAHVPNVCPPSVIQTTYGSEIQYRCKTGYVSEGGSGTLVCSARGQWEGANFTCTEIDCGMPPVVTHAELVWNRSTSLGSVVHYRCRDGFYIVSGRNVSVCIEEGQWEEVTVVCKVNDFILFNESCLKWRRDGVGSRSEDTYSFQIQGQRDYQRELFFEKSFNYSTADDSPVVCLDLQPGTNYTVNITGFTSQHSAYIQLSTAIIDPPVPDVQVVVVEQMLPPLILRRVENKNGPISFYQVLVLPLHLQHSFDCNSQNMRSFFGHERGKEAYVTAEFMAMDVEDSMQFSVGDRLYYREYYNAALETGKNYSFLLKAISEWNYVKKQSCVTLAQLKGSSHNVRILIFLGLASVGTVGFLLFLCYSLAWSFKMR